MKQTENLMLSLPEDGDTFDIDDFNENFKIIDEAIANSSGKGSLTTNAAILADSVPNTAFGIADITKFEEA
jgi:hypothetical protein